MLDSHTKEDYGNLSSSGTAVLLKFCSLNSLENYVRLVYYNTFPQILYFQVQFIKVPWSANTKTSINCALKMEQLAARRERVWILKKDNIIMIQRRKEIQLKKDKTIKKNQ